MLCNKRTEQKKTSRYTYTRLSFPASTVTPYTLPDFSAIRCKVVNTPPSRCRVTP